MGGALDRVVRYTGHHVINIFVSTCLNSHSAYFICAC